MAQDIIEMYSFKWKKELMDEPWYKDHPAETYLTDKSKLNMIRLFEQGDEDLDAEAEVTINESRTR